MGSAPMLVPGVDQDAGLGRRPHRVVLVDPREERRSVTSFLLGRSDRLEVVGSAATPAEAREQVREAHADVVLMEIKMPVEDGLATIAALREEFPALTIVVSSFHADRADRGTAIERGADAYLPKPLDVGDLVELADRRSPTGADDRNEP